MSELGEKEKEEDNDFEINFEIGMGTHISLNKEPRILSLLNPCPRCGCRMNDLEKKCDCCGYFELPIYEGIF